MTMTSASIVVRRRLVASLVEQTRHPLGVVEVHLAAERLDQVFLRHCPQTFADFRLSPFALRRRIAAGVEQLASARPNLVRDGGSANHPRDLLDAPVLVEPLDARHRAARREPISRFGNCVAPRAAICGRCVMQSTWNRLPKRLQPGTRRRRRRARRCPRRPRRRSASCPASSLGRAERLQREHDARQLAARHDARERPQILARVRRHEELGLVDAAVRSTPSRRKLALVEPDLEPRSRHRELRKQRLQVARKLTAAARRRARQITRRRQGTPPSPPRAPCTRSSARSPAPVSRSRSRASCVTSFDHVLQRRTVLPLQPLEQREPVLDLLQSARRRVDAVRVACEERTRGPRAAI